MLVFDQVKRGDAQLRALAVAVFCGLAVLLAGLWWVQVVSSRHYEANLETQSFRTVRTPAVRGRILDRHGDVLAENRATYDLSLYLEDLRDQFEGAYDQMYPAQRITNTLPFWERWFGIGHATTHRVRLSHDQREALASDARCLVVSNVVTEMSTRLQQPLIFNAVDFRSAYKTRRALPYPIEKNLQPTQIARFEEQSAQLKGLDLVMQSTRTYPHGTLAAHLLGHVQRAAESAEGEPAYFTYYLPDVRGVLGVEYAFDSMLRGRAGEESVMVNNLGYRRAEYTWSPSEPGQNVVLTIDLHIQEAAERALSHAASHYRPTHGAVVVIDVHSGDILAMASSPTYDPSVFVQGLSSNENARIEQETAEKNRATGDNFLPGSIFKPVVALALLEDGLNPTSTIEAHPDPANPPKAAIFVGRRKIRDTAPPGLYDLRRALLRSSNTYFVSNGTFHCGIEKILSVARRAHFGETIGLGTRQEAAGILPSNERVREGWSNGDTANVCIGQGEVAVTPLQMALFACALANGGTNIYPRFVDRIEPQDPFSTQPARIFPKGRVRDTLGVSRRSLDILETDMLADTEDPEGTGVEAKLPPSYGFRICGKTGTAQKENPQGEIFEDTTWFLSFAPYENPRYAMAIMVDGGGSGAKTCAPIAHDIYLSILESERMHSTPNRNVAQAR